MSGFSSPASIGIFRDESTRRFHRFVDHSCQIQVLRKFHLRYLGGNGHALALAARRGVLYDDAVRSLQGDLDGDDDRRAGRQGHHRVHQDRILDGN